MDEFRNQFIYEKWSAANREVLKWINERWNDVASDFIKNGYEKAIIYNYETMEINLFRKTEETALE